MPTSAALSTEPLTRTCTPRSRAVDVARVGADGEQHREPADQHRRGSGADEPGDVVARVEPGQLLAADHRHQRGDRQHDEVADRGRERMSRAVCDGCPVIRFTALSSNVMCLFPPNKWPGPRAPHHAKTPGRLCSSCRHSGRRQVNALVNVYAAWVLLRSPSWCRGHSDRLPGVGTTVARGRTGLHQERDRLGGDGGRQPVRHAVHRLCPARPPSPR